LTIVASVVIISAEVVFAIVRLYNPIFVIQRWMVFLVYMAVNALSFVMNLFALSKMPWMGTAFLYFSSIIFLVILVTCLAKAPSFQTNE
jgi:choline transport protein